MLSDKQEQETKELQNKILDLCVDKDELVIMNALTSSIINISNQLGIEAIYIIMGLLRGFNMSHDITLNDKEIKH